MIRLPSATYLRQLLAYDPDTGVLTWRVCRGPMRAGSAAGTLTERGYLDISIDRKTYKAHRLIWLIVTGEEPASEIDHCNGDRADNRWSNLRLASRAQQMANAEYRGSRKGVHYDPRKRTKHWQARITVQGRERSLGYFQTEEEARAAYEKAARAHFGEFARCC